MAVAVAYKNNVSEWVIPQVYFTFDGEGETVSRAALLTALENNTLLQEAMELEPQIRQMVEEAQQDAASLATAPTIDFTITINRRLFGWSDRRPATGRFVPQSITTRSMKPSMNCLPGDEFDLYPHGIMPDGKFCPTYQEEYGREYP
jgi:hypothetical protein